MKGAYKKTIAENGSRVKYLYQHDMNQPIGKMTELYEDDKGLVFVAEIAKTQLGKDVVELMKSGVITENSVGILREGCFGTLCLDSVVGSAGRTVDGFCS